MGFEFLKFNCLGLGRRANKRKQIHNSNSSTGSATGNNGNGNGNDDHIMVEDQHYSSSPIRKFSWDEIKRFTMNFSSSRVIGSGGFSTVYLADLTSSSMTTSTSKTHHHHHQIASVKMSNGSRSVFKQELDILRHLHHRNIVNLIGYCDDQEDEVSGGALVLEYVSNGSLQEKLHGKRHGTNDNKTLIPWRKRMAIAAQLGEALEYLHDKCGTSLPVVHGDIKASNVLLDHNLNVKLCDFGSAKMGFSSTVVLSRNTRPRVLMGSPGYTDPHYLRTGIPSKKNDVYSFGVILLELVTGLEPFSSERPTQLLTSLLGPMLLDDAADDDHARVVDPRLGRDFDQEEAKVLLALSAECLRHPPTLRPSAAQILETINNHVSIHEDDKEKKPSHH
ncbi:probable receptor-like protein kinase At1g33260 [Humulus lupulus]|uniref:probable receptor-like protein kinase At1g33260 n=1 Tax=Humulus lupulus TaxID=3486 RepID=UPI002B40B8CF|nr:probable receptor-like protein kinase At1g33260 [Humulus lupulus]